MVVGVVVNPVAGGGQMRRQWPAVLSSLEAEFGEIQVAETLATGDACALARKFALTKASLVIAAGGDGTISEVVDGLLQARGETGHVPELGIVPVGTGSDFARCVGASSSIDGWARLMAQTTPRLIDAGVVTFVDDHGALARRHFINVASLGLSGPTARAVNVAPRGGGLAGKSLFLWHTVRQILRYRFQTVRVTVDGANPVEGCIALVAVANGRYFGGGMMIAPDAQLDDGVAEIVIVTATSKFALLRDLRLVYGGAHKGLASCMFLRGTKIVVDPIGDPALIEFDGESPGRIPATFEMLHKVLPVRF